MKKFIAKIQKSKLFKIGSIGSAVGAVGMTALAEGESLVTVTGTMLEPVTNAVTSNLAVLLPVGLTIMAIMIGVSLIPRIIYKFF